MTSTTVARKPRRKTQALVPRSGPFGLGAEAVQLAWRARIVSESAPVFFDWADVDAELYAHREFADACHAEIRADYEAALANVWSGRPLPDRVIAADPGPESPVIELDAAAEAHLAAFEAAHDAETSHA